MPSRNRVKEYLENGYYHIYNRGVEKRVIFLDHQDYNVFLSYLRRYLTENNDESKTNRNGHVFRNFSEDIQLIAYCLMPNHFHLFIKQNDENSMTSFMKCLLTSYVMYFNKKYARVGSLFQGRYKAILIRTDEYLPYLSAYIHLNPQTLKKDPLSYDYSSLDNYLGHKNTTWVKTEKVLEYFNDSPGKYKEFIIENKNKINDIIGELSIEGKMHKDGPCASRKDKKWRG